MAAAFKEWEVIVEALAHGAQTLILRKGGIAEGRGGFRMAADRFWLFPTRFHAEREKTKPAAARFFSGEASEDPAGVPLKAFAQVVDHAFVSDWEQVARLAPHHLWTEATVRERFEWAQPAGLHVLLVRVHRLLTPHLVARTPAMAGCRSWIDLAADPADHASVPALAEDAFLREAAAIRQATGDARDRKVP